MTIEWFLKFIEINTPPPLFWGNPWNLEKMSDIFFFKKFSRRWFWISFDGTSLEAKIIKFRNWKLQRKWPDPQVFGTWQTPWEKIDSVIMCEIQFSFVEDRCYKKIWKIASSWQTISSNNQGFPEHKRG